MAASPRAPRAVAAQRVGVPGAHALAPEVCEHLAQERALAEVARLGAPGGQQRLRAPLPRRRRPGRERELGVEVFAGSCSARASYEAELRRVVLAPGRATVQHRLHAAAWVWGG